MKTSILQSITFSVTLALLSGCTAPPIQLGSKETESQLKQLHPVPGHVATYACRGKIDYDRLARSTVVVDDVPIGSLLTNTFAYTVVEPGNHDIHLDTKRPGLMHSFYGGGRLKFEANPGDVLIFWVGVTAKGFGVLTVDRFEIESDARACVEGADYAVLPPP